ncbi:MAG TPA: adenylate/guanylate cyclase domain-containing protein [Gaiellaceae bacterium]|nr:adenylate/guanylate cyclase domain-containing protein [Gaiellaceae bacterium]
MGLSAVELAERASCPLARVEQLVELGILVPRDDDGPFSAKDVHRVRLMQGFEDAGIGLDVIAEGIAAGRLSYENLGLYLPEPTALAQTAEELAVEVGRPPELIGRLLREFGLAHPEPDERLREDEILILRELLDVWAVADDEVLARLARAYGQNLRKVVASDIELAGSTIFDRMRREVGEEQMQDTAAAVGTRLMNLGESLLLWLRGRHLEHEILAVTVQTTEDYLRELGLAPERVTRRPAIAFLDLTGYTALTEEHGDEAGADLADRLATLVHEAAQPHGGNPVKWLGDGVMFHFDSPSGAVLTGLELVEATPAAVDVRARVGINAGNVIFRDGDYFGRTVNVASRIADYARPGEVLVSDEVRERWEGDGVRFEEIGPVALKGLRDELTLYAASRGASR